MSLHQHDRRLVLYPAYLDAGSTVAQGRVLAKAEACPHPDVMEMYEACRYLGLQTQVEDKHYPRAWWTRGRLRVKLCDTAGDPVIASIPNKRTLLQKVSAHIKAMPVRKKPPQYIPPPLVQSQDPQSVLPPSQLFPALAATRRRTGEERNSGESNMSACTIVLLLLWAWAGIPWDYRQRLG